MHARFRARSPLSERNGVQLIYLTLPGSGSALGVSGDEGTRPAQRKSFVNPDGGWRRGVQIGPRTRLSRPTGYIPDKTWDISGCGPCVGGISLIFRDPSRKTGRCL